MSEKNNFAILAQYLKLISGLVVLEHLEDSGIIRVIGCELWEIPDPNMIIEYCWNLYKQFGYRNIFFHTDGSHASTTTLLKIKFGENLYWQNVKDWGKNSNIKIRPISFNSEHKEMLSKLHAIVTRGHLAIPEKHDKLITSMRTAYAEELSLKKEVTSYDDLLDGLRLALKAYNLE